jgi:hypothetical protein
MSRPNVLVILMASACAPSRASLLTGQYPSLHGVTQTDGFKDADGPEVSWLEPDGVPTLGDGDGYLLSIDDHETPIDANIDRYLEADLLYDFGFSEWVGPEPHGLGKHNTGTVKDPCTAAETIELLGRLADGGDEAPWLTVCSSPPARPPRTRSSSSALLGPAAWGGRAGDRDADQPCRRGIAGAGRADVRPADGAAGNQAAGAERGGGAWIPAARGEKLRP